ncbi:MAG TPA: SGNH/GDSL hydrolase family protein [Capsulimonadaceae bacterium]|jgi:acyl-CoA thioesterase-1
MTPTHSPRAVEPGAVSVADAAPLDQSEELPTVLIVGDSISLGYTEHVRELLAGKVDVYRVPDNAGPSSYGVAHVREWVAITPGRWNVIHFNFGLHDIKLAPGLAHDPYPGGHQVTEGQYASNLREMISVFASTGARLIYATTTPVPTGKLDPPRQVGDEAAYNAIATGIAGEHGIVVNDLYSLAKCQLDIIQQRENVHFTDDGYRVLGAQVAAFVEEELRKS